MSNFYDTLIFFYLSEDWTGPINYFRNLPYTRLGTSNNQQIATRTLLIVGNSDPSVSLEDIVHSTEYVEYFNVKIVQGAGHFPHQEKPESVNESIIKFLVGKSFANWCMIDCLATMDKF